MTQSSSHCTLHYLKLLSIPYVGNVLYWLQIRAVKMLRFRHIFASNRNSIARDSLFRILPNMFHTIYCPTFKFGRTLHQFQKANIIFSGTSIRVNTYTRQELHNLMWTLVYCRAVTLSAEYTLHDFLPDDYPVSSLATD